MPGPGLGAPDPASVVPGLERVGILGAGSIGCYLGAHLIAAGVPTVLVGRAALCGEVAAHGLSVSAEDGRAFAIAPQQVSVATEPQALAGCDLVLVTVKGHATAKAGAEAAPFLRAGTTVVSFQNGVRNAALLRAALPQVTVLAGMVPFNVVWKPGAHFHRASSGALMLEVRHGAERPVLELLARAGLAARAAPDIDAVLWGKLLVNLNNSIDALAGIPLREELLQPGYRRILSAAMREALGLLRAAGIRPGTAAGGVPPALAARVLALPTWAFERLAARLIRIDPQARSSMAQDLEFGRPTEIEQISGEVVALAERLGRDAPVNRALVRLVRAAEQARRGSPRMGADELARAVGLVARG